MHSVVGQQACSAHRSCPTTTGPATEKLVLAFLALLFLCSRFKKSLRCASKTLINGLARPRLARPTTKGMATTCPSPQLSTDPGQWGQRIGSPCHLTTRSVVLLGQTDFQESLRRARETFISRTARPRADNQKGIVAASKPPAKWKVEAGATQHGVLAAEVYR